MNLLFLFANRADAGVLVVLVVLVVCVVSMPMDPDLTDCSNDGLNAAAGWSATSSKQHRSSYQTIVSVLVVAVHCSADP